MGKIVIVNSIDDARDCVKRNLHLESFVFSTHPGTSVYLREKHGISSNCVSEYLSHKDLFQYKDSVTKSVDSVLSKLDEEISPLLNKQLGTSMNYFKPMYSYFGKLYFSAVFTFVLALGKIIEDKKVTEIHYYPYTFDNYYGFRTDLSEIFSLFFKDINSVNLDLLERKTFRKIVFRKCSCPDPLIYIRMRKKISEFMKKAYSKLKTGKNSKNILVNDLSYELEFLPKDLRGINLVFCDELKCRNGYDVLSLYNEISKISQNIAYFDDNGTFDIFFFKKTADDFLKNLKNITLWIGAVKKFHENQNISLGIWDLPPVWGRNALQFEFLRSKGIKVMGFQHGSSYCDCFEPWHFDLDFSRCDYFASFGFDHRDLKRSYPYIESKVNILPIGKIKRVKTGRPKKKIDIVFPLSIITSIFSGGLVIAPIEELAKRQIKILEFLDSLDGLSIFVKLAPGSNHRNCAVLPVLNRFHNLKVIDDVTLTSFLDKYSPHIVIIDSASTPLYEVINLDTEIFLMDDIMHPFEREALVELEKRVYYSIDVNEIISLLDSYIKCRLPQKRDKTFERHYVYRDDSKENVVSFIKRISSNQELDE